MFGPRGMGLGGEHPRGVEQRRHRRHLDEARLLVQRAAERADRRGTRTHRDDGLGPRHPPGDPGELARVAERLGVHRHDLVFVSSSQNCRRSLAEMSALSPSDTNQERPRSRSRAWRSSELPSDPDCIEIATCPTGSVTRTSAACSEASGRGEATPMLDGPMMRSPLRRARATIAATSTSVPSTDVITTAPRMRLRMQASMVVVEVLRRHGDDRQGDVVGQVVDGRVARVVAEHGPCRVHRVHRHASCST